MAKSKIKSTNPKPFWWQMLSIFILMPDILYFMGNASISSIEAVVSLIVSLLLSYFIWKQNLLAFKTFRLLVLLSVFTIIVGSFSGTYEGVDISYFGAIEAFTILSNIAMIISLFVLWIQLKKEKKISW